MPRCHRESAASNAQWFACRSYKERHQRRQISFTRRISISVARGAQPHPFSFVTHDMYRAGITAVQAVDEVAAL